MFVYLGVALSASGGLKHMYVDTSEHLPGVADPQETFSWSHVSVCPLVASVKNKET